MTLLKWIVWSVVGLAAALLVAGQAGLLRGKAPEDLGVRDGKLKRPARTPNSVSSQADLWPDDAQRDDARIQPLPVIAGDPVATMARLKTLCDVVPGATVVTQRPDYLYVQFQTRLLKFVDDTEFWYDPAAKVVQVRSASRVGRKDFGVNRARIEDLRARLAAG
jgi:uncharacterized protein (DUF1499 family)